MGPDTRLDGCCLIELPRVADPRGNLTFIEGESHIPFQIRRVYYLYDVPGGEARGGHAHRDLQQFIIAASGSFDVVVGKLKRAPVWMRRCGLEWFFRFLQEPRRMFKRYFIDDPYFFWLLLKELFRKPGRLRPAIGEGE